LATRRDNQSKTKPKSKQSRSKPAFDFPFWEERTAEKVARTVMQQRRKPLRAPGAVDVTALLIAERNERDDELVERIARSVAGRRRSTAHGEDDLDGARDAKRARITVTLENDLIRSAQAFTGIKEKSALIRIALTQLVEREAAKKLAALGGTMPDLKRVTRRRLPGK
jgi:Arc/MetJ family transcription regulator